MDLLVPVGPVALDVVVVEVLVVDEELSVLDEELKVVDVDELRAGHAGVPPEL